jgi:hypothetical protein
MIFRRRLTLSDYDLTDPEDLKRLRENSWRADGREGAWPLRGPRPRDKSGPRPPRNGRRANGARPT